MSMARISADQSNNSGVELSGPLTAVSESNENDDEKVQGKNNRNENNDHGEMKDAIHKNTSSEHA